jgi:glutathionyl-hydroquinone reductase
MLTRIVFALLSRYSSFLVSNAKRINWKPVYDFHIVYYRKYRCYLQAYRDAHPYLKLYVDNL